MVIDNGKVLCFGDNNFGQCGFSKSDSLLVPKLVRRLYKLFVVSISCGANHTGEI